MRNHDSAGPARSSLVPVLAAAVAVAALAALLLAAADRWNLLLLDFRLWRPVTTMRSLPDDFFERQQSATEAQRPFRVSFRLPGRPRTGAYLAAERRFRIDPDATYCFSVLSFSERRSGRPRRDEVDHRAVVWVDDRVRVAVPARAGAGGLLRVEGIRSPQGFVDLRVGLRAEATAAPRPASPITHFEHARFGRCRSAR